MKVTEVRIKLTGESDDRLLAFCSITFDECFVIRDLKIIDGPSGPFVAMPSRKLTRHCRKCYCKNHLRASFCNQCGNDLRKDGNRNREKGFRDQGSRLYADIAHPINAECRELIQNAVTTEYFEELERSKQPGYQPRYDDEFNEFEPSDTTPSKAQMPDKPSPPSDELREENVDKDLSAGAKAIADSEGSSLDESEPTSDTGSTNIQSSETADRSESHLRIDPAEKGASRPRRNVKYERSPTATPNDQVREKPEESLNQDDDEDQFGAGILD